MSRSSAARGSKWRKRLYRAAFALLAAAATFALFAAYGGYLLVAPDPLPEHADAAVVLAGSDQANAARFAEAARLLENGDVDRIVLMVGTITVWGEWLPDLVRRFVEREYGDEVKDRIIFCEGLADSTLGEAILLQRCLDPGWGSIVVVTSNYHTQRTRLIWKAVLKQRSYDMSLAVVGVFDGSFAPDGWWRRRQYAKTWLFEISKLGWYFIESTAQ